MTEKVQFAINIECPIAVYVQIENQVQFAIASGRLQADDNLPSVREMSSTLNINPNTVTKSYRDLELMQLVKTRRGVGVTVTDKAPKLCRANVREMVSAHLTDAAAEAMASGYDRDEVLKIVTKAIDSGCLPYQQV